MGRVEQPEPPAFDHRVEASARIEEAAHNLDRHLHDHPADVHDLDDVERAIVLAKLGAGRIMLFEREAEKHRPTQEAREPTKRVRYPTHSEAGLDAGLY